MEFPSGYEKMQIPSVSSLKGKQTALPIEGSEGNAKNRIDFKELHGTDNRFAVVDESLDNEKNLVKHMFFKITDTLTEWRSCKLMVKKGDSTTDIIHVKVNKNSLCKRLGISKKILDKAYAIGGDLLASDLVAARIDQLMQEKAHLTQLYSDPEKANKDISRRLETLIAQMYDKGPEKIYLELDRLYKDINPDETIMSMLDDNVRKNIESTQEAIKYKITERSELSKYAGKRYLSTDFDTLEGIHAKRIQMRVDAVTNNNITNTYDILNKLDEIEEMNNVYQPSELFVPYFKEHAMRMIQIKLTNRGNDPGPP